MRVPPMSTCGLFGVRKYTHSLKQKPQMIKPIEKDTVSFSSTEKYYRLYITLPDEIKEVLSPREAINMFKNMELLADGLEKGKEIARGSDTDVYENPWLGNYYIMISRNLDDDTRIVYSQTNIGNLAWEDPKDKRIQLLKRSA